MIQIVIRHSPLHYLLHVRYFALSCEKLMDGYDGEARVRKFNNYVLHTNDGYENRVL